MNTPHNDNLNLYFDVSPEKAYDAWGMARQAAHVARTLGVTVWVRCGEELVGISGSDAINTGDYSAAQMAQRLQAIMQKPTT